MHPINPGQQLTGSCKLFMLYRIPRLAEIIKQLSVVRRFLQKALKLHLFCLISRYFVVVSISNDGCELDDGWQVFHEFQIIDHFEVEIQEGEILFWPFENLKFHVVQRTKSIDSKNQLKNLLAKADYFEF